MLMVKYCIKLAKQDNFKTNINYNCNNTLCFKNEMYFTFQSILQIALTILPLVTVKLATDKPN